MVLKCGVIIITIIFVIIHLVQYIFNIVIIVIIGIMLNRIVQLKMRPVIIDRLKVGSILA